MLVNMYKPKTHVHSLVLVSFPAKTGKSKGNKAKVKNTFALSGIVLWLLYVAI